MASVNKLEGLDLTQDEVSRLTKAFKDEEFRKLFMEYAEEISDPENRKRYEEEIALLESEKGMDCKFVHPNPGHVIKTRLLNGDTKCFFNICQNEYVQEARCTKETKPDGTSGLAWRIPHSFAPVKDDVDKQKKKCKVFDFVVHPNTYRMSQSNQRFLKMLHDTALDSATKQFGLVFDKSYITRPKMTFKGTPVATVIRTKKENVDEMDAKLPEDDPLSKVPYPYDNRSSEEKSKLQAEEVARKKEAEVRRQEVKLNKELSNEEVTADGYIIPNYIVKHSSNLDLQQFTSSTNLHMSTRPDELIVEIDLPLLKGVSSVDLDIFENKLKLVSENPVKYFLEIVFPYEVDENKGNAKFEKNKHKLIVKLPVVKKESSASKEMDACNKSPEILPESNFCENGNNPLIEVLSSDEMYHRDGVDMDVVSDIVSDYEENVKANGDVKELSTCSIQPTLFYTRPEYLYHQNDESVNIILEIKNATRESLYKHYILDEAGEKCVGFEMKVASIGSGGFPMHFSFCAMFQAGYEISADDSFVHLNDENIVVTLVKSECSLGLWEKFLTGLGRQSLEEKRFLTEHNVKSQLGELDREAYSNLAKDDLLDLEVTDMNSQCLSVEIKEKQGSSHSFSESAEEIEVVHDLESPKIQSILKQRNRTMSESSDDLFHSSNMSVNSIGRQQSTGGESSPSPVTEESENEQSDSHNETTSRKKTVSFSEHVDKTTYKATQSVNSMKSTLKNKKKKAHKREIKSAEREKRQQRRRRNSNSLSEPSSDDLSQKSEADSEVSAMDIEPSHLSGNSTKHIHSTNAVTDEKVCMQKCSETSLENQPVMKSNESESKLNVNSCTNFNDKNDDVDGTNVCDELKTMSVETEKKALFNRTNADSDDGEDDISSSTDVVGCVSERSNNNKEKPDTMLSWEDRTKTARALIGEDGDRNTDKAFAFSNKLMYELDVD